MHFMVVEKERKKEKKLVQWLGLKLAQLSGQGEWSAGLLLARSAQDSLAAACLLWADAPGPRPWLARPSGQGEWARGVRVHGYTAGSVVRWLGLRGPGPPALSSSSVYGGPGAARRLSLPPLPCSPSPTTPMGSAMLRRCSGALFPPCSSTLSGTSTFVPSAHLVWRHSSFPCRP